MPLKGNGTSFVRKKTHIEHSTCNAKCENRSTRSDSLLHSSAKFYIDRYYSPSPQEADLWNV